MENGTMLRTQKQRFYRLMKEGCVLDAYALRAPRKLDDSSGVERHQKAAMEAACNALIGTQVHV
jgi:hypothetical protein